MDIIHISYAGPDYWLPAVKPNHFEDHPYCGPIFLNRAGEPLENQPKENDRIWSHVNAWYQQGKRFQEIGGKRWCLYETDLARKRREGAPNA